MTLDQFKTLPEADQRVIWEHLVATVNTTHLNTKKTKKTAEQILEHVTPQGEGSDPLEPIIMELMEISMRTENKIDSLIQTQKD